MEKWVREEKRTKAIDFCKPRVYNKSNRKNIKER
jgi:hypothetical protein